MIIVHAAGVYEDIEAPRNPDAYPSHYFVALSDDKGITLRLWVGQCEAWAIASSLDNKSGGRNRTHEFIIQLLMAVKSEISEIRIISIENEVYKAVADIKIGKHIEELEINPSDGIVLALIADLPIKIAEDLWARLAEA